MHKALAVPGTGPGRTRAAPAAGANPLAAAAVGQAGGVKPVSAHVHVIPDNSVQLVPNVGIVVGERAALVIDTGMGPRNGAAVLAVAQKLAGPRELFLVITHFHAEHDLGAQAFPASTKLIRSHDQEKDIDEFKLSNAQGFAARAPVYAELLKDANYRKADISFENDYTSISAAYGRNCRRSAPTTPAATLPSGSSLTAFCSPAMWRCGRSLRRRARIRASAVACEPRSPRSAQAHADRPESRSDRRGHDVHRRISHLPERGPRAHRRGKEGRPQRRTGHRDGDVRHGDVSRIAPASPPRSRRLRRSAVSVWPAVREAPRPLHS